MEQRDYLLRQIEMMTQFLLALIRKLTGMKDNSPEEEQREVTDMMMKEQLDISLSDIAQIPVDEIADFIMNRKGIHQSNIDLFAEVLILNAKGGTDKEYRKLLLLRALELLQWEDRTSGVFSMERQQKINEVKVLLEQIK
jgi:hypothetical protein